MLCERNEAVGEIQMEDGLAFAKVDFSGVERFQTLGRSLGATAFGLNVVSLQPKQRMRLHRHRNQEEVYIVLQGTLSLATADGEHRLRAGEAVRVAPPIKRQLMNRDDELCVVLALGGAGLHVGRDGEAFVDWDATEAHPPQELPLPAPLP